MSTFPFSLVFLLRVIRHRCRLAILFIAFVAYSAVHLAGAVSPTTDEAMDLRVVACYIRTGDLIHCNPDITQAPLPYYLHAFAALALQSMTPLNVHRFLSYLFGGTNLLLLFAFARREFGRRIALFTFALAGSSLPLLASSRMVLTHSNSLFCLLTTGTLISFYYFTLREEWRYAFLTAILFAFSVASSLLAVSLLPFFVLFFVFNPTLFRRLAWKCVSLPAVSLAIFFLVAPYYVQGGYLERIMKGLLYWRPYFWYFNYFLLDQNTPPWWFSLLTFLVKIGPWWAAIYFILPVLGIKGARLRRHQFSFLLALQASFVLFLLLTASLYRNDAPHHQIHFYPFVYLSIGYVLSTAFSNAPRLPVVRLLPFAVAAAFALQLADVIRFFPHYLFYGSQYGARFVGEFYGPAVLQCQDSDVVQRKVDELIRQGETVLEMGICGAPFSDQHVFFDNRDVRRRYHYVAADYLMLNTLVPSRGAVYRDYLRKNRCREYWTHLFPPGYPVYVIYSCDGAEPLRT